MFKLWSTKTDLVTNTWTIKGLCGDILIYRFACLMEATVLSFLNCFLFEEVVLFLGFMNIDLCNHDWTINFENSDYGYNRTNPHFPPLQINLSVSVVFHTSLVYCFITTFLLSLTFQNSNTFSICCALIKLITDVPGPPDQGKALTDMVGLYGKPWRRRTQNRSREVQRFNKKYCHKP